MKIIDGKKTSERILSALKEEVKKLARPPFLTIILSGKDPSSLVYVKNKIKACKDAGIGVELIKPKASKEAVIKAIEDANKSDKTTGILLQLPLDGGICEGEAIEHIDPSKDVDGLTSANQGRLACGLDCFIPATPLGIMMLLSEYKIDVAGKNVLLIGRSRLIGKPLLQLFLQKDASVSIVHSKTKDLGRYLANADIVVSGCGKPGIIKGSMIKEGTVLIDAGFCMQDGKCRGDVDFESVKDMEGFLTPVPGGVGPMTVASLLLNVAKTGKMRKETQK